MANHEGWYLKANVDISGLLQANKQANSLLATLRKVDAGSNLKGNDSLAKSIKSADIATASYIERLKSEGKNYEALQEKAKLYTTQIQRLSERQGGLSRELDKIASSSNKTSDAYNIQKSRINQTATAINKFKDKLKSTQAEMAKVKPTAFNNLVSGARKVDQATTTMKEKAHSVWSNIKAGAGVAAAGIGAVGAAAISGAKQASTLQQRYREITNLAVLGGEKTKEVTKTVTDMQAQGRNMSIKYGKSQKEIAEGYEDLVKRGYTTKQALGAMESELQASVASGDKFSDVTTVSSQVLEAFGMRADSTSKMLKNTKTVVNELAYSADATSTGFSDLGVGMSYVGAAAKAANVSLAESVSAMGVLSNNGLESDKAGTGLRSVINNLSSQVNNIGKKNSIFTQLGIKKTDMVDAHGHLKDLATDMEVLRKAIDKTSKGDSVKANGFYKSIFGTTGMNAGIILAQNTSELEKLTKKTKEAGETGTYVTKLANKNMGTAQGRIGQTKQALNAFKMTLGNALLPAVNEASERLSKFLLSKDGQQFQKDVGGAVKKVANAVVSFIEYAAKHKGQMKAIGGAILAGYSISKAAKFISFLGSVKTSIDALKGGSGILSGIARAAGKLSGKSLIKGTATKAVEEGTAKTVGKQALTNVAESAGSTGIRGIIKSGTSKVFGGKLLSSGATKLGTKLGGAASTGMSIASGVGVALNSGIDLYKAITAKTSKKKFENYGKSIGSAIGGGVGLWLGGPGGAAIGSTLGQVAGGWAGKMAQKFSKSKFGKTVGHTFQQVTHEVSEATKPVSREWGKLTKQLGSSWNSMSRSWGKVWNSINRNHAFKAIKTFVQRSAMAHLRLFIKQGGTILKTGLGVAKGVFKTVRYGIKGVSDVVSGLGDIVGAVMKGDWKKAWQSAKKTIGKYGEDLKGMVSGIGDAVGSVFKGIYDTAKNAWDFISGKDWEAQSKRDETTSVADANAAVARMQNGKGTKSHAPKKKIPTIADNNYKVTHLKLKSHAAGGAISSSHGALVGEAGPELAYKTTGGARILGANGPELTRVHSGERILNARDTRKVMSGGLGRGYTLKGYASGTTGLKKTSRKIDDDYKKMTSKSSKTLSNFSRKSNRTWKSITSKTGKETDKTRKSAVSDFTQLKNSLNKQTDKTRKNSISDFTNMRKGVHSQMDKLHNGVVDLGQSTAKGFGKALDKMHDYAKSAMQDTIDQINKGISGIDKVLSQFGGNASVIKPVKFATGTDSNGRLTENTLAMLNDAESGPRQEAVVTESNEVFLPQGRNTVMPLKKGWGVLNGTQTQQLGVRRFAKGSGVSHSQLKKIASKNGADPAKSFADMFTKLLHAGKTVLSQGTVGLAENASTKFGVPWNNAMWTVINNAIGGATGKGGTREAFLKYAESTFSGVPYVMGAMTKAASDCSGMVAQALKHFGINIGRSTVDMQNSDGVQYLGKNLANTIPGDLVIFGHGTGAAGHVGIIKNPKTGTMFNETPPHARVTDIASDKSMGYGYYRVKGLHNASTKSTKNAKADKRLISLAKRQLGPTALKWIKDKLGDEGSLGGNIGGEGVKRWAGTVKKILGMLHLSTSEAMVNKVLRQINTESSGNPHAKQAGADPDGDGSGPAMGLMQTKRATFNAYKKKGDTGGIYNGPSNIYAGLNYAKHRYGNDLSALGNGHGYATGGEPPVGQNVLVGEKGPEIAHFKDPVHIYSHEQSKHIDASAKVKRTRRRAGQAPTINININGSISSRSDATKYGNIIKEKIAEVIYDLFGEEYGADPSVY